MTVSPAPVDNLRLVATPDHLFVGETHDLKFTLSVPVGDVQSDQVNLVVVQADGADITPLDVTKMHDDGNNTGDGKCDAVPGDRQFSACRKETTTQAGKRCYRVRVQLPGGVVSTPTTCVDVIERLTQGSCLSMQQMLVAARSAYTGAGTHEDGLTQAELTLLEASGDVAAKTVGQAAGGFGLWVEFGNGVLGALPLGVPEGFRGEGGVGSHRVLLLRGNDDANEVDAAASIMTPDVCPPFEPSGPHTGDDLDLERLRTLGEYGVVAFSGHGGAFFEKLATNEKIARNWRHTGSQEIWWMGSPIRCEQLLDHTVTCNKNADCPDGSTCLLVGGAAAGECISPLQSDLLRGRVIMGADHFGITPAFVDQYARGMPNALVYAGTCFGLWNGSMAMAFFGGGAGTFVGYDGLVREGFANEVGTRLFENMAAELKPAFDAMCFAADPQHPETRARAVGASQLTLESESIINGGLESLEGWSASGDARLTTSFCGQPATAGKFMLQLGTGLGSTATGGQVSQSFCIPAGAQNLIFSWRFFSAEFAFSCGLDGFQDRWEAKLTRADGGGEIDVKSCDITDMCHYSAPPGCGNCAPPSTCKCGGCYEPYETVEACTFDGEPVWATAFVQETVNVAPLAGQGPVTLRIQLKDGHPALDTGILIDDIRIQ